MDETHYARYRDPSSIWAYEKPNKKNYFTYKVICVLLLIIFVPPASADSDTEKYIAYYGWINCSGLDWADSGLTFVIIADDNQYEIQQIRSAGVDVYLYRALGSTYASAADKNNWEQHIMDFIESHDYVDGFFWDEIDPGYYGQSSKDEFNQYLTEINDHVHMNGQRTIANGVRYYADHCNNDFYMWESFMSSFEGASADPEYYYVDFFVRTGYDHDPYSWINNIAKWEYLQNSSVLNKTLAYSYGDPSDDDKSNYDYIAARVLGLNGFGYVDANNFAATQITLAQGMNLDLGVQLDYTVDEKKQRLSGQFTNGGAEDDVKRTISRGTAVYSITASAPGASASEESEVEHYDENKVNPSMQTMFLNTFDVLLIIAITTVLITKFPP